jgi:prevent-host-death family protein
MRTKILSSDEARSRWRDVMDAATAGADVVIERYGKPVIAVIPYADYVEWQEQLEDLRAARQAQAALEEWRRDPSTARPWSDVEAELVADGLVGD